MSLISSIITDAYRECNMLPLGRAPSVNQATEALRLYNQLLATIYGSDAGESLVDWPLGGFGQDEPQLPQQPTLDMLQRPDINSRLIATNPAPIRVYLTPQPQDGSRYGIVDPFSRLAAFPVTLDANGRVIEGAPTLALSTNGLDREWIYRADLGAWLRVSNVLATDDNPFPTKFDTMFIVMLAIRLSPRYGRAMTDESISALKTVRRDFVARYLQSAPLSRGREISWPFMSKQSYGFGRGFSSTSAFARGDVVP